MMEDRIFVTGPRHAIRPLALRKEVRLFAEAMERQLRNNDHKGGWDDCSDYYLFASLEEEMCEFLHVACLGNEGDALAEAGDVANFLMMWCDNAGLLKEE